MSMFIPLVVFMFGLAAGAVLGYFAGLWRQQASCRELQIRLEAEQRAVAAQSSLLAEAQSRLGDTFKSLSADVLKSHSESFLQLAQTQLARWQTGASQDLQNRQDSIAQSLAPVREGLTQFNAHLHQVEKDRIGSFNALAEQLRSLQESERNLRLETSRLVTALRAPQVRGQWGELQLRKVIELSGMLNHCDFTEQVQTGDVDGRVLRPDVVVHLPGNRHIVIDAKTPLSAFLDSLQAETPEQRTHCLQDHLRLIKTHIESLSRKAYWEQFEQVPDFVVLFLPGEQFFSAALEQDPGLIEDSVNRKVILATPTTLIALLKAVAYGWRQESLTVNARQISELGAELYKRLGDLTEHLTKVGKQLDDTVKTYNKAIGTLENRVLVSTRKLHELHAAGGQDIITAPDPIETVPRIVQAEELAADKDPA
jgi:DNA recombination protein RmuC